LASHNGRYVILIEGDNFEFERGVSPVELLQPDDISIVLERMRKRAQEEEEAASGIYGEGYGE
jgi:hypothetical protein